MADSCPKCGGWHEVRLAGESINCLRAQVAQLTLERDGCRDLIATQRTRIAEVEQSFAVRVKEYREKIEQLETDKANYHDKWLNALEKLKAIEQDNARLREGIQATINYVRSGVHCRTIDHTTGFCDCEEICGEFAALLAKPEGAKR